MRDYDPTLGRYIQADPLGLVDGASVYGYALQNPGFYVDPTGEYGVPGAIAGAIAGGAAGYISTGCWQGAVLGALVGGAVGATGGTYGLTASGAGAIGFGAAASSQLAGNYFIKCSCDDEPTPLADLLRSPQFWATNVGGAFGGAASSGFGSSAASAVTTRIFGKAPYFGNRALQAKRVDVFVSESIGGLGAATGEFIGSRAFGGE